MISTVTVNNYLLVAKYICLVKDVIQSSLNHDKPSLDALNKMHNYFLCECVHII